MQTRTSIPANLGEQTRTLTEYQGESLYSLAERRLRELVEAGDIEAIRLALSRNSTQETIC